MLIPVERLLTQIRCIIWRLCSPLFLVDYAPSCFPPLCLLVLYYRDLTISSIMVRANPRSRQKGLQVRHQHEGNGNVRLGIGFGRLGSGSLGLRGRTLRVGAERWVEAGFWAQVLFQHKTNSSDQLCCATFLAPSLPLLSPQAYPSTVTIPARFYPGYEETLACQLGC